MYNTVLIDGVVYASPGSPEPRFISKEYPITCTLCYQIYGILYGAGPDGDRNK